MIPSLDEDLLEDLEQEDVTEEDVIDFKMQMAETKLSGYVEEVKLVKQWIYKVLNTERYQYGIYSWDFGIELRDLIGMPVGYVCPVLELRIEEALTVDDRITDVSGFEFDLSTKNVVAVKFNVSTIYGDIAENMEVPY